jgi:hypothetical protein
MDTSKNNYREIKQCRVCNSENLVSYLNLGDMPLANGLIKQEDISSEKKYPLDVLICKDCNLSQISVVVDPSYLFKNYVYRSSISNSFKNHCKELADELNENLIKRGERIIDIASNDGSLLFPFKKKGNRVLGIEPALNLAEIANNQGIETVPEFWNAELANKIKEKYGKAKIITAFNVFAHVDSMHSFAEGAKTLLDKNGYWIIESPHLLDLIKKTEFDTIYHEHLSYLSLKPVKRLLEDHGLRIAKTKKFKIHGGSIRMYIEHSNENTSDGSLEESIKEEENEGLYDLENYFNFRQKVEGIKNDLVGKLQELKLQGKKIAAFGASAKGNTLLNYCQISPGTIDCIFDDTPEKQNKLSPGIHLPIKSSRYLLEDKPDYLLLLAWNFAEEIISKTDSYRQQGGRYIIPIPSLKII